MGCCLATDKASKSGKNLNISSNGGARDYDPPSMEEETVKEVLSETPTRKLKSAVVRIEDEKTITNRKIEKKSPVYVFGEEISEVSEICSVSESVSTTTVTDKREDDEHEVIQRINRSLAKVPRNRSYSGDLTGKRERVVSRSPVKRSDPSLGRRNDGIRSGSTTERRRIAANVNRRDPGECSGRRSRSPAMRVDVVGRSSSTRKTGQSPGRNRGTHFEKTPMVEDMNRVEKWPPSNRSLEDPLVSLECFIFL